MLELALGEESSVPTRVKVYRLICGVFIVIIRINNTKHRVYAKNNFYKTCIISNSLFSVFKETVEGESIERN